MMQLMVAVRDAIIILALSWIGLTLNPALDPPPAPKAPATDGAHETAAAAVAKACTDNSAAAAAKPALDALAGIDR